MEEDELTLKFSSSKIKTAVFHFTVEGNQLILERTGKEAFAAVTFEKTAD